MSLNMILSGSLPTTSAMTAETAADPLFSFADSNGSLDFSAALASQAPAMDFSAALASQVPSSGAVGAPDSTSAWFQNSGALDTPKFNGKPLFDLEQNSLNNLLSQHLDHSNLAAAPSSVAPQLPAAFSLFGDDHLAPTPIQQMQPPIQQMQQPGVSLQQTQNGSMFVATIVDPNQDGAPPQQMLFLPGTNQVIPMSGANEGQLMNLNDMPMVFNSTQQQQQQAPAPAPVFQQDQQQPLLWPNLQQQQAQRNLHLNALKASSLEFPLMQQHRKQDPPATAVPQLPVLAMPPKASTPKKTAAPQANMPVRPLSAYNFFFSDERERILKGSEGGEETLDTAKKQRLLIAHLSKDRTKRRPHRKTHGKINFTTLSKLIGQRWRQLSDERKNFYREVAAIDLERYQRELRERGAAAVTPSPMP